MLHAFSIKIDAKNAAYIPEAFNRTMVINEHFNSGEQIAQ